MKCGEARSLFSPYLDGAVTGTQMHALSVHLQDCSRCEREYLLLRKSQQLLVGLGRRKAPPDLALKLRVVVSQEIAGIKRPRFQGVLVRLENAIDAFMVPVTAGLVSAVVIFGILMGFFALPETLQGNNDDVPLMLYTAPELQQSAFGTTLNSINADSLLIEASVDANGRIEDYRIISDPNDSKDLLPQVKNMLIFTTFRPATTMGRPTSGRAVLSFSKISVRG
ncbi:MAG: anti-sigma factor [Acidobacteria bacterium]|jgi:hypothetical protein|nr:MAG: anti-sigma factor [Acidobacteriota bacterium]HMC30496.1 anti-sigma factor [Candidatus Angelobacter sp.]